MHSSSSEHLQSKSETALVLASVGICLYEQNALMAQEIKNEQFTVIGTETFETTNYYAKLVL